MAQRIRVALIYGGVSGEHSISCVTAGAVMRAIDRERFDVLPIGIRRDGMWVLGESDPERLVLGEQMPEVRGGSEQVVIPPGDGSQPVLALSYGSDGGADGAADSVLSVRSLGRVDVAFPLLHGPFGEDGTIQGALEMANIPYAGCGVFASAAGMDKHYMKIVLEHAGIPVSPYCAVTSNQWQRDPQTVLTEAQKLHFPLYVKPARAGSSLGITRVDAPAKLAQAIEAAHEFDPKVLIEEEIRGQEVECAVLGGHGAQRPRASLPGRIVLDAPADAFYDFSHKYIDTAALTMQIPAEIGADATSAVQETAVRAFEAFGCEGLTRVDCFVTERGDVLVNEINTMPGFTPFSMYPALWEKSGIPYTELVNELLMLALERGTGLH
ncbi:MAG: D-alanine--D-alanine ligase [Actinomycetaceae bacterium]|nr:D-alanine--D-alanine ligase [Arcanobacterium sp.]MDD7686874.1 D-alanine--D-alanine ligase [Actinomycetaceae bacterium]